MEKSSVRFENKNVGTILKEKRKRRKMNRFTMSENTCSISCEFAPILHRVQAAVHYRPLPRSDPLRNIQIA